MLIKLIDCLPIVCLIGCSSPQPPPVADAATGTVTLEIQVGEKTKTLQVADVAEGTTLESLMRSIDEIPITLHGSGTTAFVESIGDTATSASEGWTFKVDGEWSDQGVGTTVLHPPTTITWSFGDWKGEQPLD